jgi:hypothetical protein
MKKRSAADDQHNDIKATLMVLAETTYLSPKF